MGNEKTISDKHMVMALCFLTGMVFIALPSILIAGASIIFEIFNKDVAWTIIDYFKLFFYSLIIMAYILGCYNLIKCFLFEWKVKEYES